MATVRKKVDNRIRVQIENGVALQHRTMFVVVGDRGRDQVMISVAGNVRNSGLKIIYLIFFNFLFLFLKVVILHHMLSKAAVRARPSVLWCYKKDLGFSRCVCVREMS